jgi:hypothetical protein
MIENEKAGLSKSILSNASVESDIKKDAKIPQGRKS